jgi:hypothetical protein
MASLLSTSEIDILTGILNNFNDTFKREIIVHKEPIANVSNVQAQPWDGFSNTVVDYIPVTGVFQGRIFYSPGKDKNLPEIHRSIPNGAALIRVDTECKNYLLDGKTEKLVFDGKNWEVNFDYEVVNFKGLIFYEFITTSKV